MNRRSRIGPEPRWASTVFCRSACAEREVMSDWIARALSPPFPLDEKLASSFFAASTGSMRRPVMTTLTPWDRRAFAVARPIQCVPPMMSAFLPVRGAMAEVCYALVGKRV